jgi:integrase/recombinase XerD
MKLSDATHVFYNELLLDGYSQATIDIYSWGLNLMVAHLGDPDVEEISNRDLRGFMYHMRENYKSANGGKLGGASLDNIWKAIRSFFRFMARDYQLDRPDKNLKRPNYTSEPVHGFSEEEIKRLLRACMQTAEAKTDKRRSWQYKRPTALRDKAMILFMLDTGVRVSEMCRLTVGDVSLPDGEVRIAPYGSGQKTKGRYVYLGKSALSALYKYLVERGEPEGEEALFASFRGGHLDRHGVAHMLRRLGKRAEVKDVHPHRFRHTFAIEFLRNGGDVYALKNLLGHSNLSMCQRYLALTQSDAQEAHRRSSPADRWRL